MLEFSHAKKKVDIMFYSGTPHININIASLPFECDVKLLK